MKPVISVILSVYNGASFISEAIESVLSQTFTAFELIIVNDGSDDNTENIINSFSDKRIQYFPQQHKGLVTALNFGLDKSVGKFIARIDADDCWHQEKLEHQYNFLIQNPTYSLVASSRKYIDTKSQIISKCIPSSDLDYLKLKESLGCYNIICHSSVLFKSDIIADLGYYSESIPHCEDYDYWFRILKSRKAYLIGKPLVLFRIHNNMQSIRKSRRMSLSIIQVKMKIFNTYGFKINYLFYLIKDIARLIFPGIFTPFKYLLK